MSEFLRRAGHLLSVNRIDEDNWAARIVCPGLKAGQCEEYAECSIDGCDPDDDLMAHGVEHIMHSGGELGVPTGRCFLSAADNRDDAIHEAFADVGREPETGTWHVDWDGDEFGLILMIGEPAAEALNRAGGQDG